MERTLTAFSEALWSGDTEQVNRALDEVHEMELEEQAELFDEGFEICRELYAEALVIALGQNERSVQNLAC